MKADSSPQQMHFPSLSDQKRERKKRSNAQKNNLDPEDRMVHDWYRFVLSFPPHLVRNYIEDFGLKTQHTVLDPFCGTGTTLVESKLHGIQCIGLEANPFTHFASAVKVNWQINPTLLKECVNEIADSAYEVLESQGIDDDSNFDGDLKDIPLNTLPLEASKLLIKGSISTLPLHKILILQDFLNKRKNEPYYNHALLALAKVLVFSVSNLRFGPEVGVGKKKIDAPVIAPWIAEVNRMINDLHSVSGQAYPGCNVYMADARQISHVLEPQSVDAVITSPPYPNEKDYSRTTRLESVLLGFISNKDDLRASKKTFIRSNTRGVYKGDDDSKWVAGFQEVQHIADTIERRRIELGKTSGFEKLYGTTTRLYFGGIARHLSELRTVLSPGAMLSYVVGDQASYLRVMIRTGQILAKIAQSLGYELVRTDLFRTRYSTATKEDLREEVVVLRWKG